jgi:hypothetical protein
MTYLNNTTKSLNNVMNYGYLIYWASLTKVDYMVKGYSDNKTL